MSPISPPLKRKKLASPIPYPNSHAKPNPKFIPLASVFLPLTSGSQGNVRGRTSRGGNIRICSCPLHVVLSSVQFQYPQFPLITWFVRQPAHIGLKTGLIQALSEQERQSPGFRISGVTHNDRPWNNDPWADLEWRKYYSTRTKCKWKSTHIQKNLTTDDLRKC